MVIRLFAYAELPCGAGSTDAGEDSDGEGHRALLLMGIRRTHAARAGAGSSRRSLRRESRIRSFCPLLGRVNADGATWECLR